MEAPARPASGRLGMAFATLITTDEYLMGVQALVHTVRSHHNIRPPGGSGEGMEVEGGLDVYDMVVLCTETVSQHVQDRLAAWATVVEIVDAVPVPGEMVDNASASCWEASGYTKLQVWGLTAYEKVLYLDADCLVMEPLHDLFARDIASASIPLAAAPDCFPPDRFNAGVLLLLPSRETLASHLAASREAPSYDGGDTGLLNHIYSGWWHAEGLCRLTFRCNAQRTMFWLTHEKNPGYWAACQPLRVLHFSSSPKPWSAPGRKGGLEMEWWSVYVQSQLALSRR